MSTHITISTLGRERMFSETEMLPAVRTVARVLGDHGWLFSVVDDHLHGVVAGEVAEAGAIASGLSRALTSAGASPLAPAHLRPVDGRRHLETLIVYLVRQPSHHGLRDADALWVGSCAQDLLGARQLVGFDAEKIAEALPRLDVAAVVAKAVGVAQGLAEDATIRALGAAALWRAAAGAFGLAPEADGRSEAEVRARRAYGQLARAAGFAAGEARAAAGIAERTWRRTVEIVDVEAVRTVRRRVALLGSVAAARKARDELRTGHNVADADPSTSY